MPYGVHIKSYCCHQCCPVYVNLKMLKNLVCCVHGQYSLSSSALQTHFHVLRYVIGNIRFQVREKYEYVLVGTKNKQSS